ncbi:MAG: hypothetical protein A2214_01895 [Candidatus Harrisonbacteria bacterium RIFOXYA1_FULL_48_8]|uniref:Peptidase M50 domain-containing protein n=1 Tax=Candidatus Harrisonbacteria bacterium RIFOXYA1_FULL_48_8 TaxID=1798411 RepID=A0A1G1ZWX0_9BACT|nr:MAG: hypothetical protein A2214_01895 [Candidatus Harrisonbacteria bacterium RIFOXYA1_FULL_48_8]
MDISLMIWAIVVLVFSVILHEVSHGWIALKFGDRTAEFAGRLTLNPIPHLDLFGSIILPAILIFTGSPIMLGWAKPVPVNPDNFRNYRWGTFWVSIAGIATNLCLALVFGLAIRLLVTFGMIDVSGSEPGRLFAMLCLPVIINLFLAVFNLVPIPPLDGFNVFASLFGVIEKAQAAIARFGLAWFVVLFVLLWVSPIISIMTNVVFFLGGIITGI